LSRICCGHFPKKDFRFSPRHENLKSHWTASGLDIYLGRFIFSRFIFLATTSKCHNFLKTFFLLNFIKMAPRIPSFDTPPHVSGDTHPKLKSKYPGEASCDFGNQIVLAAANSKTSTTDDLREAETKLACYQNILCFQGKTKTKFKKSYMCPSDFVAKYDPFEMRCLALVSHNGLKSAMKDFVIGNKHILKKFRLTGTRSTMTMLHEVFDGERIVFGPTCESGPLGGDAELVSLMCSGRLGGIIFFQDPMTAHAHQSDIDCLCRQALVHNTLIANTPSSALMLMHVLRSALEGDGRPELIPSFFFSLQSPSVAAYKEAQAKEIERHSQRSLPELDHPFHNSLPELDHPFHNSLPELDPHSLRSLPELNDDPFHRTLPNFDHRETIGTGNVIENMQLERSSNHLQLSSFDEVVIKREGKKVKHLQKINKILRDNYCTRVKRR
jgi:methylglyoxal synthase